VAALDQPPRQQRGQRGLAGPALAHHSNPHHNTLHFDEQS
jgi:hypothetical protein